MVDVIMAWTRREQSKEFKNILGLMANGPVCSGGVIVGMADHCIIINEIINQCFSTVIWKVFHIKVLIQFTSLGEPDEHDRELSPPKNWPRCCEGNWCGIEPKDGINSSWAMKGLKWGWIWAH